MNAGSEVVPRAKTLAWQDPELEAEIERLARSLSPKADRLQLRFTGLLRKLGLNPAARRSVLALTPTAAAHLLAAGRFLELYGEQVAYHGRRLAKLRVTTNLISLALDGFVSIGRQALASTQATARGNLAQPLVQWRLWVSLALNQAFHQVAEIEAATYHQLFEIELRSRRLEELLAGMLEALAAYCKAEWAWAWLWSRTAHCWRLANQIPEGLRHPIVESSERAARRLERPRCQIQTGSRKPLALSPCWAREGYSCWSIPLRFGKHLAGVMQFGFSKPYEWLPREVELLTAAARHCSLAAEKARLMEELAAREEQIRDLARRLVEVEERERKRISAELHDEAGQSLMCIRLHLEMLERRAAKEAPQLAEGLASARELTERTITEIRRVLSSLSPSALDRLGLAAAIRQLATRFQELSGIAVSLRLKQAPQLSEQVQTGLYRLVQESLNNVARHSSATHVNIFLGSADGEIRLCVEDDGVGFDVEEAQARVGAMGLAGMKERASLLGGRLEVISRPGKGTRINFRLPIQSKQR